MVFRRKNLDDTVELLRNAGDHLIPYNHPNSNQEDHVGLFKTSVVTVDGYLCRVHFNKMDYGDHYVETCQISGEHIPFIPFNVTIKIGQKFLGSYNLSLIEYCVKGKMYWCWAMCVSRDGKPIEWMHPMETVPCEYDNFKFDIVQPGEINFH